MLIANKSAKLFLLLLMPPGFDGLFAAAHSNQRKSIVTVVHMDNVFFAKNGGYPPLDRNTYLPLLNSVKAYKPKVIFLNLNFARKPLLSEKHFASRLNSGQKLILPFNFSREKFSANYDENVHNFGTRIAATKLPDTAVAENIPGIILPSAEIVSRSLQVCAYQLNHDEDRIVRSFYLYFVYKNHAYSPASLCILNHYLLDTGWQIVLSGDFRELRLIQLENQKVKSRRKLADLANSEGEIPLPIRFQEIPAFGAQDVLDQKAKIPEGKIILVGDSADGVADWHHTPRGVMPAVDILANEVNTLWELIKDDLAE